MMMVWIMGTALIIISFGMGFYLWRKRPSRIVRIRVVGLTLATCAIVLLATFAIRSAMRPHGTDDPSISRGQSQSQSQKTITGPASETPAPTAPVAQSGNTPTDATGAKTPPSRVNPAAAPATVPVEMDKPNSIAMKVSDDALNALIGDAIPIKPEGSTMVNTIAKLGTIKPAGRDTPTEDDYSFPEVVQGSDGMAMIIPDEPLPSVSSRRQITTGDGDIPVPGEVVALTYDMFSWSTGKMVESSQTAINGPLMYRVGGEDSPIMIPEYLDKSIRDRPYGSTVQVVFKKDMADLPLYLDRNDGYVLMVRIDKPDMTDENAFESMKDAMNN